MYAIDGSTTWRHSELGLTRSHKPTWKRGVYDILPPPASAETTCVAADVHSWLLPSRDLRLCFCSVVLVCAFVSAGLSCCPSFLLCVCLCVSVGLPSVRLLAVLPACLASRPVCLSVLCLSVCLSLTPLLSLSVSTRF